VSDVVIRAPKPDDAAAIASLMGELGYPSDARDIPARLSALTGDPSSIIWLGELDGRVVAVGTGRVFAAINQNAPVAWLTALVVAENARGRGVGQRIVRAAEDWARTKGASKIALTSALHRDSAHQFYKNLGYEHTGVRLAKSLKR
jgi:GNAT superfamily N-acetyltransferase